VDVGAANRVAFEAHGVIASLRFEDPLMLAEAERQLPWGARLVADDAAHEQLTVNRAGYVLAAGAAVPPPADPGETRVDVMGRLATQLRHHVAVRSPELFVHAGAVAVGGCALLFPGRSHTGKSMLAAALLRNGAHYLSDEYAVIDKDGRILPFAQPLSIRDDGKPWGRNVEPSEFGACRVDWPTRAVLIAVVEFSPTGRWDPQPMEPGEAVLAVLDNTVAVRADPHRALRRVRLACDRAQGLAGERGDADLAAADLLARLRSLSVEQGERSGRAVHARSIGADAAREWSDGR
jgi:hypothetical protein